MNKSILAAALSCLALVSCGSGTVTIGGGDDGGNDNAKITVKGNIRDFTPVTTRDIVVFAFTIDKDDTTKRCPCPPDPSDSSSGKAVTITDGSTEFTLSGLDAGSIGLIFLLDNAGTNADGTIDPGDPVAILDDVDCDLEDVRSTLTVTLKDVDLAFSSTPVSDDPLAPNDDCKIGDPPAEGRARADLVTLSSTN